MQNQFFGQIWQEAVLLVLVRTNTQAVLLLLVRFKPCAGPFFWVSMTTGKSIVLVIPLAAPIFHAKAAGGGNDDSRSRKYRVLCCAPCVGPLFLWGYDFEKKTRSF